MQRCCFREDNDYIIGQLADGKVKSDRDIPRGAFRHLIEEFLESSQWKTFSINDDNWEKAWNFLNYIYDAVENTRLAQRTAEKDPLEFQMYLDQLPFESLPVDT